jgi:TetR/AcrR family acrAB operon transcriptional repressor
MVRRTKEDAEQTRLQIIAAARKVFHERGVSRSSLEQIATEAGVTRGAVYWHFANKPELFFAVRQHFTLPLIDQVDQSLFDETLEDPLEGMRIALRQIPRVLRQDQAAREMFEVMCFRCEYVDEFAPLLVRQASCGELPGKLEFAYRRAQACGKLRAGIDPALAAQDTTNFVRGSVDRWLAGPRDAAADAELDALIDHHIAMRRP